MPINVGMQRKTVAVVIAKKVNNLLATITDPAVKEAMERDIIVTGGCIASMMTGEEVNDYDIYFRTKDTAIAVARYYVQKFNETNDCATKVRGYAPVVKEIVRTNLLGEEEPRIVIWMQSAGAAGEQEQGEAYQYFEGAPPEDADRFIDDMFNPGSDEAGLTSGDRATDAENAAIEVKKKAMYRPVFMSENAITLSDKVQLIIRFFGEPHELHRNYDFVHAMGYYDNATKQVMCSMEAMEAMLSKTLVYKGSLYPLASMFRLRKFINRGWRITAGQMLKIAWQINSLDLKNPQQLREQLIGVDQAYMHQLLTELEKEKGKIDDAYLAKLIDRIFQ